MSYLHVRDALWYSAVRFRRRPGRVAMLAFGPALGVGIVVGILSISASGQERLRSALEGLGSHLVVVAPPEGQAPTLPLGTIESLASLTGVDEILAFAMTDSPNVRRSKDASTPMIVNNVLYAEYGPSAALNVPVAGRDILRTDASDDSRAAVLGLEIAEQMGYPSAPVVGSSLLVDGVPHTIVGVYGACPGYAALDHTVVVPRAFPMDDSLAMVTTTVRADRVANAARAWIPATTNGGATRIAVARSLADAQVETDNVFRRTILALGMLSSLIGAAAVANVMTLSIQQRRHELAIQRSIGIPRQDLGLSIVFEGALAGTVGAVVGALVGAVAVGIASSVNGWIPAIDWSAASVAITASTGLCVIAGIPPSIKAMSIPPADALRAD